MTTRAFHMGDILSVTTGRLVSLAGFGGIHEILDFVTGDILFTHQLPRACDECRPELLRQHPDLADVRMPNEFDDAAHVDRWLAEQIARYGETREVAPMAVGGHVRINPLVELATMAPHMSVIPVVFDGADTPNAAGES